MATELTGAMDRGSLCHEFDTGLPAADVWEVYGGLLVGELVPQLLPKVFSKVELVEGDGGAGTVLLVTFSPGTPGSETLKEKFIKVDNENYIKETIVTEGGFLDHGFQKYLIRIEIIGKEDKTSIIRSTIEYEVDDEHTNNAPVVSTGGLAAIAEAVTKYIKEQKSPEPAPEQSSEEQSIQGSN
ncbi:norbelladine synthase-like [Phragmites australis]|uniref:norbelladine synthase-like n=1 Tax=Phragmites australis TaxID=29695 RepID=UPI002D76540E|nr:norbelladine synthase-like [Phragmites australis]